jgi:hypothetical protein
VAAAGSMTPGAAVRRIAAGTNPASAATTWVSSWRGLAISTFTLLLLSILIVEMGASLIELTTSWCEKQYLSYTA